MSESTARAGFRTHLETWRDRVTSRDYRAAAAALDEMCICLQAMSRNEIEHAAREFASKRVEWATDMIDGYVARNGGSAVARSSAAHLKLAMTALFLEAIVDDPRDFWPYVALCMDAARRVGVPFDALSGELQVAAFPNAKEWVDIFQRFGPERKTLEAWDWRAGPIEGAEFAYRWSWEP